MFACVTAKPVVTGDDLAVVFIDASHLLDLVDAWVVDMVGSQLYTVEGYSLVAGLALEAAELDEEIRKATDPDDLTELRLTYRLTAGDCLGLMRDLKHGRTVADFFAEDDLTVVVIGQKGGMNGKSASLGRLG